MNPFRRKSITSRFAALALAGMLLSQFATIFHPGCSFFGRFVPTTADNSRLESAGDHCHDVVEDEIVTLCIQHCDLQHLIRDAAAVELPPHQTTTSAEAIYSLKAMVVAFGAAWPSTPKQILHRPTPHPAELLLI